MKITKQSSIALGTLGVLTATTLSGAITTPAHAGADTWKKIAIGAGAVTGYGVLKGNKKVAIIGGLATAGSYLKYKKDKKKENKEEAKRVQFYKNRYGSNWRNHYKAGV